MGTPDNTRGNWTRSLCVDCNNSTGAWYNPAYLKFVRACAAFATPQNAGRKVKVNIITYPQRIAKQGLAHLISTSQSGIREKFPEAGHFLLDREKSGVIGEIHIGIYMRVNKGARFTGIAFGANFEKETIDIISEFSFWPIGWILAFDKNSLEGTLDVTSWLCERYEDKKDLDLEIPCKWAVLGYPKDFRTPEEINRGV